MRLSIFNFRPIRLTVFFLVSMIFVFGGMKLWVLEHAPKGLRPLPGSYWMNKTHTQDRFDIVLIGDSRLYRGISPAAMELMLPKMRILNFSYSSAGMSSPLLENGEDKLDTRGQKIIILGLTPYSLTGSAALNEHFKEFKNAMYWPFKIPYLTTLVAPHETIWAVNYLLGSKISEYYQVPHPDGWIESDKPAVNFDETLREYDQKFSKEKVSLEVLEKMLEQIRDWKSQGITVFGFRPPASEQMEELEDRLSGYDETEIQKRFVASGGIWIDIPDRYSFITYDGSHLKGESARMLSKTLAQLISGHLINPSRNGQNLQ